MSTFLNIAVITPTKTEQEFFRNRPDIAGMARADNSGVVLSPFFKGSAAARQSVITNESARIFMRTRGVRPDFDLTEEQAERFESYSPDLQDKRETVAARILAGDPSSGTPTKSQKEFIKKLRQRISQEKKFKFQ